VDKPCGVGPAIKTNDMEYYVSFDFFHFNLNFLQMCGHYKPPRCKRGQTALVVEGIQTQIHCRCRKKSLVQVKKSDSTDEFICGKPVSIRGIFGVQENNCSVVEKHANL
jgi:hypothetical protein